MNSSGIGLMLMRRDACSAKQRVTCLFAGLEFRKLKLDPKNKKVSIWQRDNHILFEDPQSAAGIIF